MITSALARQCVLRIVAINDVYELVNLPKLQTFLSGLSPPADAVVLAGDFVSPSPLSSIDEGRGMVATLRAAGITHACLGNHEADLSLPVLCRRVEELSKSATVVNSNMREAPPAELSESAAWLSSDLTPPYAVIATKCGRAKAALLGLMSDEEGMFRDGTFKGVPISNVKTTFAAMRDSLVPGMVDTIVPVTHQSLGADRELAERMLHKDVSHRKDGAAGIILGGHEHHPIDETVTSDDGLESCSVRIVKSGYGARGASLVDLTFDLEEDPSSASLAKVSATRVDLREFPDSAVVKKIADKHLSVIDQMEREIVVDENMVPLDVSLSSKRTRYEQTTVGGFFCQAIKEEMEADVAIINGASIKGGAMYNDNRMSLAQLKTELPFPTKMVVVPMTRGELIDAIEYSRTQVEEGSSMEDRVGEGSGIPRKGYLQVDFDYDQSDWYTKDNHEIVYVALPRNLLNGFCNIQPLVDVGDRLKEAGQFPSGDDFVPAIDVVTRHCCKSKWMEIASRNDFRFGDYDLNNDGVLDGAEIKLMMKAQLGYEPEDSEVEHMIAAIDADGNGTIDSGEFSFLLATMERQKKY